MKHITTLGLNDTGIAASDKGENKEDVLAYGSRVRKIILQAIVHARVLTCARKTFDKCSLHKQNQISEIMRETQRVVNKDTC